MKPMKYGQTVSAFLIMSAFFFALPGCQREEGPLEKAGKDVDQAVENFTQPKDGPAERAGQAVDDATEKAGEKLEHAGDRVQDAAKN